MTRSSQLSEAQIQARRDTLAAAERSGIMEGLPPVSPFAQAQGELYALGQITADEAVKAIIYSYTACKA